MYCKVHIMLTQDFIKFGFYLFLFNSFIWKDTSKSQKYTRVTLLTSFAVIQTTAIDSVTCLVDAVNIACILTIFSIVQR